MKELIREFLRDQSDAIGFLIIMLGIGLFIVMTFSTVVVAAYFDDHQTQPPTIEHSVSEQKQDL